MYVCTSRIKYLLVKYVCMYIYICTQETAHSQIECYTNPPADSGAHYLEKTHIRIQSKCVPFELHRFVHEAQARNRGFAAEVAQANSK